MSAIIESSAGATDATLRFDVIDERARHLGISKGELAGLVGVDQSTIWRYRKGMKPALDVAQRLASVLGLTVEQMTGNPTPAPPPGPSTPPPPAGPKAGKS